MAKLAAITISLHLWQQMMTVGYKVGGIKCVEGLPEGAEFLYFARRGGNRYGDLQMVFTHESFQDLEQGAGIPEIPVVFTTFHVVEVEDESW